jgi:hypothetical protein
MLHVPLFNGKILLHVNVRTVQVVYPDLNVLLKIAQVQMLVVVQKEN